MRAQFWVDVDDLCARGDVTLYTHMRQGILTSECSDSKCGQSRTNSAPETVS
jgi:hypothetical protein